MHRSARSKGFFDQAERRGIFVNLVLAETHWHVGHVGDHAELSSHDGKPYNGRPGH